jgi:formylglycine-generating enzyme required for sulfatase activity
VTFPQTDVVYTPGVRLPIGEYRVRITRRGYIAQEFAYRVRYGENHHHVVMEREFGVLTLAVDPLDADVQVTYADAEGRGLLRLPYAAGMRIPIGAVSVRARAMGRRSVVRKFDLTRAGAVMRIRLETLDVQIGSRFRDTLESGVPGPLMVIIPPGEFVMGDPQGAWSERPARTVVLTQPFSVSVNEITMGEYLYFSRATGKSLHDRMDLDQLDHPVRHLYWSDAEEYTRWLSGETGATYRLLTETEWEYVARAGTKTDYYFGDDVNALCTHANFADASTGAKFKIWEVADCDDGFATLAPVGSLAANPFGLHDVYGNVSEWVLDCDIKSYAGAANDGGVIFESAGCVSHGFRGGSWDSSAAELRSTYRNASQIGNNDRGLRVLREF